MALEAFKLLLPKENSEWVSCTFLVQPAIPFGSVVREVYKAQYVRVAPIWHFRKPSITGIRALDDSWMYNPNAFRWIDPYFEDGEYFEACKFSREVIATMSAGDAILTGRYSLYSHFPFIFTTLSSIAIRTLNPKFVVVQPEPDLDQALGSPNTFEYNAITAQPNRLPQIERIDRVEYPSNLNPLNFSKGVADIYISAHGQVFDRPELARVIYQRIVESMKMPEAVTQPR